MVFMHGLSPCGGCLPPVDVRALHSLTHLTEETPCTSPRSREEQGKLLSQRQISATTHRGSVSAWVPWHDVLARSGGLLS
jgi:hypothetical protein